MSSVSAGIPQINTYGKLYLGASRTVSVEIPAHDPAGNLPLPELVFLQPVPDVVVEPRHHRAAYDSQPLQTHAPSAVCHAAP